MAAQIRRPKTAPKSGAQTRRPDPARNQINGTNGTPHPASISNAATAIMIFIALSPLVRTTDPFTGQFLMNTPPVTP